jgi:hypothetical protein
MRTNVNLAIHVKVKSVARAGDAIETVCAMAKGART